MSATKAIGLKIEKVPCTIVGKYAKLNIKKYNELITNPDEFEKFWNYEIKEYQEILIGEHYLETETEFEFNINDLPDRHKMQENTIFNMYKLPIIYYKKIDFEENTIKEFYHVVQIYKVLDIIPRAPNNLELLFDYTIEQLEIDLCRIELNETYNQLLLKEKNQHKSLLMIIINWYADFIYDRINFKSKIKNIELCYDDSKYNIEYNLYSNLIEEIQGH